MTVNEILSLVIDRIGFSIDRSEEGLVFGNPKAGITGVIVCWMTTIDAIKYAVLKKCQLMIVHEDLRFPPPSYVKVKAPGYVDTKRISLLKKHNINVIRLHGALDEFCILDDFDGAIGLFKPVVNKGFYRVFEVKSTTIGELVNKIKKNFNLKELRMIGNHNQKVNRIGILWGGLGLSINSNFIDGLFKYDIDTVIAGEVDEYTMHALNDLGIAGIEVGHMKSENVGLNNFVGTLKKLLPQIKVFFYSNENPYKFL